MCNFIFCIFLSTHLFIPIYILIYLALYLPFYLYTNLSSSLSIFLLYINLTSPLSIFLLIYYSIKLFIYLSTFNLSNYLFTYQIGLLLLQQIIENIWQLLMLLLLLLLSLLLQSIQLLPQSGYLLLEVVGGRGSRCSSSSSLKFRISIRNINMLNE